MKRKILIVVGTRPNFIKITRFREVAQRYPDLEIKIAHTGQHSDQNMAEIFFSQFNLKPDYFLNLSATTPAGQIGETISKLSQLLNTDYKADLIITPGDVNSTLATAITANKMDIPLAHLESGLRSFDRSMPEEINRIVTDGISDHCFVTEKSGVENLRNEQCKAQVHFVGNTMIDTLVAFDDKIDSSKIGDQLKIAEPFILMTIHRPSNVDSAEGLKKLGKLITGLTEKYRVVFPVHPRTLKNLQQRDGFKDLNQLSNLTLTEPLGYFEFQWLVKNCKLVITDSGGIQEETTFRRVPCLTLRNSTERPVTVDLGTNRLIRFDLEQIFAEIARIEAGKFKKGSVPDLWDGKATERIVEIISGLSL